LTLNDRSTPTWIRARTGGRRVDIAIDHGRVVTVGVDAPERGIADRLLGSVVAPPFADSHVHLLGLARALTEVDLGSEACPTLADVVETIRANAARLRRTSGWTIARGFDDALVAERRLPTRTELDRAEVGPLRVRHRTGHASLFNSAGFATLPPLPVAARLEVDADGEPIMVVGVERWIGSVIGRPERASVVEGLRAAHRMLLRAGIARVWDATPRDAEATFEFRELLAAASFGIEVRTMASTAALETRQLPSDVIKLFPDELGPSLAIAVQQAHDLGASVAVHCTSLDEVERATSALEKAAQAGLRDRIEHATLCEAAHAQRLAAIGAIVVANPSWLVDRGAKYAEQLLPRERDALLPLRTLRAADCVIAFGSDAPTSLSMSRDWIHAAIAPRDEALTLTDAVAAARAEPLFTWRFREPSDTAILVDHDHWESAWTVLAVIVDGSLHLIDNGDDGKEQSGRTAHS
jgi:predicted amidohydrolase YtcJ